VLATVSDKKIAVMSGANLSYYRADVVSYSDYYPFGAPMTERTAVVTPTDVRYGFNGKEVDSEINGNGNAYDFGARMYDSRLGRWWSVDPEYTSFLNESPYSALRNNAISCIDKDGKKWVNYYDQLIANKQKALIENPHSKKILREIKRLEKKQAEVNAMIQEIKNNDVALFNYIEYLTVIDPKTEEKLEIPVIVKIGNSSEAPRNRQGNTADGVTRHRDKDSKNKYKYVQYESLEFSSEKTNDQQKTMIPAPFLPSAEGIGFEITIFTVPIARAVSLSNEIGDVMYRMEYPDASIKQGGNAHQSDSEYRNSGSGKYSFEVEDKYKERVKNSQGKDASNNPYPLKKS
jgi:RHS repeat-associated protein